MQVKIITCKYFCNLSLSLFDSRKFLIQLPKRLLKLLQRENVYNGKGKRQKEKDPEISNATIRVEGSVF